MHKNFISASRDLENASSFSSPVTILLTYKLFNEDIHGNIFVINRRYFKFFFFSNKDGNKPGYPTWGRISGGLGERVDRRR